MNSSDFALDVAMDFNGGVRGFADWFDLCAKEFGLTDTQIARAYDNLAQLNKPGDDDRRSTSKKRSLPRNRIKEYRTGQRRAEPETAYRIGRALQECDAPVTGLDALIAGHYVVHVLGTVASHISIGISRMTPPLHPFAPEIAHVLPMLDRLMPRISRELAISKLELGIRAMHVEEFSSLQKPLSSDQLFPPEQTKLIDEAFMAWRYQRNTMRQKLPPAFAAAIALLEGNPTPEVVELAAQVLGVEPAPSKLGNPKSDIMDLLSFVTPRWVLRICGEDRAPEHSDPEPPADYTALTNFFDEFEAMFSLPGTLPGCRCSPAYPHVNVKLHESEYHPPAIAVDVDWVVVDEAYRGQQLDVAVIEYLKQLAEKHALTLVTWPADDVDSKRYHDRGFTVCEAHLGMGWRVEWPRCAHKAS